MWFLNKETGLKWEVHNKDLIKRLKIHETFEVIKERDAIDYSKMAYKELIEFAKTKGINAIGFKKHEIVEKLNGLEE